MVQVVVGIALNVLCTVGCILANKHIWSSTLLHGAQAVLSLSALHFVATFLTMIVMAWGGLFELKKPPLGKILPLCVFALASVAFNNLNLSHNTVGFYQVSKLACIPSTILLQYLIYNVSTSHAVKATLLPILVGVGVTTVYDVEASPIGWTYAVIGVVSTSMGQILTGKCQKELNLNAVQLLTNTSPIQAVGTVVLAPLFDDWWTSTYGELWERMENYQALAVWVALSCALAVGVNITNFLVIGKTDAVTYQVVGHFKTCAVIVLGYLFFHEELSSRKTVGIVIAIGGMLAYSEVKRAESGATAKAKSS